MATVYRALHCVLKEDTNMAKTHTTRHNKEDTNGEAKPYQKLPYRWRTRAHDDVTQHGHDWPAHQHRPAARRH